MIESLELRRSNTKFQLKRYLYLRGHITSMRRGKELQVYIKTAENKPGYKPNNYDQYTW